MGRVARARTVQGRPPCAVARSRSIPVSGQPQGAQGQEEYWPPSRSGQSPRVQSRPPWQAVSSTNTTRNKSGSISRDPDSDSANPSTLLLKVPSEKPQYKTGGWTGHFRVAVKPPKQIRRVVRKLVTSRKTFVRQMGALERAPLHRVQGHLHRARRCSYIQSEVL